MFFSSLRFTVLISLVLSPITTFAKTDNSSPLKGLFPPLTPFINYGNLVITYGTSNFVLQGNVNSGVEVSPNATSLAPDSISITPFPGYGNPFFPINETQLYTLVMIDPDAPSRTNPTSAQILHFVQTGLKITVGDKESECFTLTTTVPPVVPYRGPAPPVDSGLHRYTFLLFMQPDETIDLGNFSANNRSHFDVELFAVNNALGPPLAGAYFQAQNASNNKNKTTLAERSNSGPGMEALAIDDDSLEGPLVFDTSTPTPPAKQTGDVTTTPEEIIYTGVLTDSYPAQVTSQLDSDPVTDSVEYGDIGDWTMTAPGDDLDYTATTTTTDVPGPTLEFITSVQTPETRSGSVAGIEQVQTQGVSTSASASATTSIPSWLKDGGGNESNSVERAVVRGRVLLAGFVVGLVALL